MNPMDSSTSANLNSPLFMQTLQQLSSLSAQQALRSPIAPVSHVHTPATQPNNAQIYVAYDKAMNGTALFSNGNGIAESGLNFQAYPTSYMLGKERMMSTHSQAHLQDQSQAQTHLQAYQTTSGHFQTHGVPIHSIQLVQHQPQAQVQIQPPAYPVDISPRQKFPSSQVMMLAQSPASIGTIGGPGSAGSNSGPANLHNSPLGQRLVHNHAGYASSSSSYPPSNEGLAESPVAYGSVAGPPHIIHQHRQSHELDINSNSSPYSYHHGSYMQLAANTPNKSHSGSPQRCIKSKLGAEKAGPSQPLTLEHRIPHSAGPVSIHGDSRTPISTVVYQQEPARRPQASGPIYGREPLHCQTQMNSGSQIQQQSRFGDLDQSSSITDPLSGHASASGAFVFPSNSQTAPEHGSILGSSLGASTTGNLDDLSTMLDLRDFEEFLNDKDAVAAALSANEASLFNETYAHAEHHHRDQRAQAEVSHTEHYPSASNAVKAPDLEGPKKSANSTMPPISIPPVTSARVRERIHERRAEELANVDKELDRLVSLVRQNDTVPTGNFSFLNVDLLNSLKPVGKTTLLDLFQDSSAPSTSTQANSTALGLVQFTPPDSPTHLEPPNATSLLAGPSQIFSNNKLAATTLLGSTISSLLGSTQKLAANKSTIDAKSLDSATLTPTKFANVVTSASAEKGSAAIQSLSFIPNMGSGFRGAPSSASSSGSNSSKATPTSNRVGLGSFAGSKALESESTAPKFNRVPIYKQRLQGAGGGPSFSSRIFASTSAGTSGIGFENKESSGSNSTGLKSSTTPSEKDAKKEGAVDPASSDAYNFTDEEDDATAESAMPAGTFAGPPPAAGTSGQPVGGAGAGGFAFASRSMQSCVKMTSTTDSSLMTNGTHQSQTHRTRKRHFQPVSDGSSNFVSVAPAGSSAIGASGSTRIQLSRLLDLLRRRRQLAAENGADFLRAIECASYYGSEEKEDNESFAPPETPRYLKPTMTCSIKMDNVAVTPIAVIDPANASNGDLDVKILPKLVIKFHKTNNGDEPQKEQMDPQAFRQSFVDSTTKAKKRKKHKKPDRDWFKTETMNAVDSDLGQDQDREQQKRSREHRHHHHKKEKRHKRRHSVGFDGLDTGEKSIAECVTGTATRHISIDQSVLPSTMNGQECPYGLRKRNELVAERSISENGKELNSTSAKPDSSPHTHSHSHSTMMCRAADRDFVNLRLRCFARAYGALPKGTFLVAKEDVFRAECPLWKIDNQNLLQKYLPADECRYRNSSTYSGWCDRVADDYLMVEVKFVKQSRTENIIEPTVPIRELFPCIVSDYDGGPVAFGVEELVTVDGPEHGAHTNTVDEGLERKLILFLKAMLQSVVALDQSKNDPNCLEATRQIEDQISTVKRRLRSQAKCTSKFLETLDTFLNFTIADSERIGAVDLCQACQSTKPRVLAQMFQLRDGPGCEERIDPNNHITATEFFVCFLCERFAKIYHKNAHLIAFFRRKCDEKLEEIALEQGHLANYVEEIVSKCLGTKEQNVWLRTLVMDQLALWRDAEDLIEELGVPRDHPDNQRTVKSQADVPTREEDVRICT